MSEPVTSDEAVERERSVAGMTHAEVCHRLKDLGFHSSGGRYEGYTLLHRRVKDGPVCDLNDMPPSLHVHAYFDHAPSDGRTHEGSVEFEMVGEKHGEWVRLILYGISRERVDEKFIARVEWKLSAMWATYCGDATGEGP